MDRLREECGIVAAYQMGQPEPGCNVAPVVVRGLLALQNRGQLSAGLTSYNPQRDRIIQTHKELGTVHEVFRLNNPAKGSRIMEEYGGVAAIGHTRYATSGAEDDSLAQPFERVHGRMSKWFAIGFNGNLANYAHLKAQLEASGYHITYHTDTEVMMHYINREMRGDEPPNFVTMFRNLSKVFDGAYNITFLNAVGDLVVVRDPVGIKPLCYGVRDGLLVAASESVVMTNLGIEDYRTLEPGEVLIANRDGYRVERYAPEGRRAYCYFEWVYFSNLASNLEGRSVYKVRHAIGRELAEMEALQDKEDCLVVSVPETANAVASSFGYHLGLPVMEGLLRNRYVGRTFINGGNRAESVRLKFTPLREIIEGKRIFLVDDTLVRGNTLRRVVRDMKEFGRAREIHVRIGNPPIMGPCFYGIDMPTVTELFAPHYLDAPRTGELPKALLERMARDIGADSLSYLPVARLLKAVGVPESSLCMACLNRDYPTATGRARFKAMAQAVGREEPPPKAPAEQPAPVHRLAGNG
ncbi:MAG: amidophosphoribosyltransferase [Candidatus Lambdaproteobacteria bacterium]|nr:amidophosphoribosyltransferase [Candidatus Lambdaproteobacteria bacterium]